ncbi:MAG: hypothetical protein ABFC94_13520 [Syntrophomonas sp.]
MSALAIYASQFGASIYDLARLLINQENSESIANLIRATRDEVILAYAQSFIVNESKVRGYYISQVSDNLRSYFTNQKMRRITTPEPHLTWTLDMLEMPSTLYVQIPEALLKQFAPLWNLFLMQILRHLQQRPERKEPHILVAIDEFPQFGKLDMLP